MANIYQFLAGGNIENFNDKILMSVDFLSTDHFIYLHITLTLLLIIIGNKSKYLFNKNDIL